MNATAHARPQVARPQSDDAAHESDKVVWVDDLDDGVCWRLLATTSLGRVGFTIDGAPCVLPVNYHVVDRTIVFRTGPDTSLGALGDGAPVAFEIDDADAHAETGWSVLVKGRVGSLTADERVRLGALSIHPWAPGSRDQWMAVTAGTVTGRAISRRRSHPDGELLPYMPPD